VILVILRFAQSEILQNMKKFKQILFSFVVFNFLFFLNPAYTVAPYNPVLGGEQFPSLYSTSVLAGGLSVAGSSLGGFLPAMLAINPALAAGEENPILDLSYILLSGIQTVRGAGHVGNAGFAYPGNWGVVSGLLNFSHVKLDSLNFGTFGQGRFSYSKDLTENLYVGTGFYLAAGSNWALGLDIGVLYKLPQVAFLHNARVGISLTGIGKPFNPRMNGVKDNGNMLGYPSLFTPHVGFATDFANFEKFKMGMYVDVATPAFTNMTIETGFDMLIADLVSLRSAYTFNFLEALKEKQTHIPSFGIGVKFDIKPKANSSTSKETLIMPQFAVKPFYNNIWAFGFGLNVKFGTEDKEGPKIDLALKPNMYISPNNDGEWDAMELPLKITDRRYVVSWACHIRDENNHIVRTIANKQPLREMSSAKDFWRLLKLQKGSVEVPEVLRWDGMLDSGEVAKDGRYIFILQASDDNHNHSQVGPYEIIVDNTPPSVKIEEDAKQVKIFSPDGDGNKDEFLIRQKGSEENVWRASILDSHRRVIRTFNMLESSPKDITWDGKDNKGEIVPDGVYSYRIFSKDKAGNEGEASLGGIIVDTNKPVATLNIDRKFFSPNGDGVHDSIKLQPTVKSEGLVACSLEVKNKQEKVVRKSKIDLNNLEAFLFDGKNDSGKVLEEGAYYAVLRAEYNNGYIATATSPEFVVDVTPPKAYVKSDVKLFSPDGDGKLDTVSFLQEGSEDLWQGKIFEIASNGKKGESALLSFNFASALPKNVVWQGLDDAGVLAKDGRYGYVLEGVDEAGNSGVSNVAIVELNTEKADIILQSDLTIFSPNNDGIKDFLTLFPIIRSKTPIESYKLVISSEEDGSIVNVKEGTGEPPTRIVWRAIGGELSEESTVMQNASYCKDGFYRAKLEVELENKQKASSVVANIEIDTTYPSVELSSSYLLFSTNEASRRSCIPVTQKSSKEDVWKGVIKNEAGDSIRTFIWNEECENFEWDGADDAGNKVMSGKYSYEVSATDRAGNTTTKKVKDIVLDDRVPKVFLTNELSAFSPNNDGFKDEQSFMLHANMQEGIKSWSFAIKKVTHDAGSRHATTEEKARKGEELIYLHKDSTLALPNMIKWNGKDGLNKVLEGSFVAILEVEYTKGDLTSCETPQFISSITPPRLAASLKPKYFSPDNDGMDDDLFIKLEAVSSTGIANWSFDICEPAETGGKHFWSTGGKGKITDEIVWDGRSLKGETVQSATDYPFTFTATDLLGLSSTTKGYIPVDILIIRDGDKLKIAVPSIIFRPNANDFKGLSESVVGKNIYVLKRVAQILNKFTDYSVQVEGHANSTTGTEEEEKEDLVPLSTLRAEAVMNILIKNGVRASRLSAVGMGGSRPVASLDDRDNWWKNRRVEFILIK